MKLTCSRCVYNEDTPGISFDDTGICNYCHTHDELCRQYPAGEEGHAHIMRMVDEMRKAGKGKKYDCIVGFSGGCDSSYLLHIAKKIMGLRPLAVHFDNGWNSKISEENIQAIIEKLDIDLYTYAVDTQEYDDIYRSFFKSAVPDIEAPTDIALAATLNNAAEKFGVKYILEGHNFRTEGISPLGWLYMDGKYVTSVHKQFGTIPLATYPTMSLAEMIRWMVIRGIRKLRPLWYMDYDKEDVKQFLQETYGWQWYGGHHLENRFTAFYHSYFMLQRYGMDGRLLGYAAQVRNGKMPREEALRLLQAPPLLESDLIEYLTTRLGFTEEEFSQYMTQPQKSFQDYPNYKKTFETLRPFFWLMAKMGRIPMSFYMKYTKKMPQKNT